MKLRFVKALALLSVAAPAFALKTVVESPVEMVVTAHPSATEAGLKILKAGGTAVDAMVAIQTVLGLVEPQSSGMGGGAFVVYYDATTEELTTFDAREKAPSGATEERFLLEDAPLFFLDAWQSALSVGVPGVPKLMEELHSKYGTQPWADLFDDAITIATEGWEMTARSQQMIDFMLTFNGPGRSPCVDGDDPWFFRDEDMLDYLIDNSTCAAKQIGTMATNPDYADLMERMAAERAKAIYDGVVAQEIVDKVASDRNPTGDATITLEDLLNYEIVERKPVCAPYGNFQVCGMGPPSSGGLAVGQIFGILNDLGVTAGNVQDPETVHAFTQAMRLAFADRDLFVGDSDFVEVPTGGLLDATYLSERASLIDPETDMGTATAGTPPVDSDIEVAPQTTDDEGGTSHISIVDQYGNALSMTSSVEGPFGAGLMVHGMLLNNQMTDFSFVPADKDGVAIANRVQANKRPRSSMSPTIVLDGDNRVAFLSGSPGGPRIIGYTALSLLSMMHFGLDPQEAANLPHFQNRNAETELEAPQPDITSDYDLAALQEALVAMNHTVVETGGESSGLGNIAVKQDGFLLGGADPRRDGVAGGRAQGDAPTSGPTEPGDPGAAAAYAKLGVAAVIGLFLSWAF